MSLRVASACARHFASFTPKMRSHRASEFSAMRGDPQNVGDLRPLEEKPQAVDPIGHSDKHHQHAEKPRQELRLENKRPNQRAEYAKEHQADTKAIGPEPDRRARQRLSLLSVKGFEIFRERDCD